MSITTRYTGSKSATSTISCGYYDPLPGSKRCRHYLQGGSCSRPDQLMCVEWLKVNRPEAGDRRPEGEEEKSLEFRLEVQEMPKPTPQPEHPQVNPVPIPDLPPPAYSLQPDQIASFKALGVSVCLESEHIGQIWIVPEYTDNDRLEISVEHAATLSAFCAAFPGATVTAFEKL